MSVAGMISSNDFDHPALAADDYLVSDIHEALAPLVSNKSEKKLADPPLPIDDESQRADIQRTMLRPRSSSVSRFRLVSTSDFQSRTAVAWNCDRKTNSAANTPSPILAAFEGAKIHKISTCQEQTPWCQELCRSPKVSKRSRHHCSQDFQALNAGSDDGQVDFKCCRQAATCRR